MYDLYRRGRIAGPCMCHVARWNVRCNCETPGRVTSALCGVRCARLTRVSGGRFWKPVRQWQQAQPGIAWWRSGRAELGAEGEAPLANSKQYHGACPVSRISRLKKCGRAVPRPRPSEGGL